jgi:hypothetical protein
MKPPYSKLSFLAVQQVIKKELLFLINFTIVFLPFSFGEGAGGEAENNVKL